LASEQVPLLFFKPQPASDPLTVAQSLVNEVPSPSLVPIDPLAVLKNIRSTRGFARLKVALPHFSFDNARAEAAMEGTALPTHIRVGFFGNFEKVAEPLFNALTATGFVCYSVWDKAMLTEWPEWEEPTIDRGFGERMTRILHRKTAELREVESDEKRRSQILDTFVKSPEFRSEMAREARREPGRGKKAYDDVLNVYARWKNDRASATELGALRKLDAKLSAMSLSALRTHVGESRRLLLAAAVPPRVAAELRRSGEALGLKVETEPP
jgi:hypothetical protein